MNQTQLKTFAREHPKTFLWALLLVIWASILIIWALVLIIS